MTAEAFTASLPPPAGEEKPLSRARRRAPAAALTDEVTALAQSLGVRPVEENGVTTYKPAAFMAAIKMVHDALLRVKNDLQADRDALDAREKALELRERAVQAREEVQAGYDALGELVAFQRAPARRQNVLARVFGRAG